jgi:hypothetical protein
MELISPRLAIESAERTKFEMSSGQKSEDVEVVLEFSVDCVRAVRWKYCAIPILRSQRRVRYGESREGSV